jgi:hypothetical protein
VAQGKLLLRGPLLCTEDPSCGPNYKFREMTVFLFEQIMIFAETVGKKTQFTSPVYTYKAHIQVGSILPIHMLLDFFAHFKLKPVHDRADAGGFPKHPIQSCN